MVTWNPRKLRTHTDCLHRLVEAKVQKMPAAEAICAWDGSLTYAELDKFASVVSQRLVRAGVRPGVYVIFAFEKSLWAVVATYAILKAGGAFVPIDPTHPQARIQEMLGSVQAKVVVTSDQYMPLFQQIVETVIVMSESTVKQPLTNGSEPAVQVDVRPSDPIFLLFTSGSTGKPKGMVLEHGAICTHALTHGAEMGYHGARVLQFAAHTFDVAIMDFFTTLLYGGCVCIPSDEDRRSDIIGAINRLRANYAILTPSFAGFIEPSQVPTLKTLAIGGEALSLDRVQKWAEKVSLIQIYGPAEVGICLLRYMSRQEMMPENVGYPMPNCSCWLVDPDNPHQLVPFGAVGEMVITSPSLARGYHNDEGKTRASFIEGIAWAAELGLGAARFFKTGDLLRYNTNLCDGSFDFIARKDTQIKVRGQRMELGELEHHVAAMPDVAVSMVSRPSGGCFAGELVVIIQMRDGTNSRVKNEPLEIARDQCLSIDTIREYLAPLLPVYMMPAVCLVVEAMPFVPSLKVNRKVVDAWLANMEDRPSSVAAAMLSRLDSSVLRPDEVTASVISAKVAEMLDDRDGVKHHELLGKDFNLQNAGVDSVQIISLAIFVRRTFKTKMPLGALLSSKLTVRDVASIIDEKFPTQVLKDLGSVDLLATATNLRDQLLGSVSATPVQSDFLAPGETRNVLVTGATGYLGSIIVKQLLELPNTSVFALLRCSDEDAGMQRLIGVAETAGWWCEAFASRLTVWKGDLTAPTLGLPEERLRALRGSSSKQGGGTRIHSVIHNGAVVHYSSDYPTLEAANVTSTIELLRMAADSRSISDVVFVSGGRTPDDEDEPVHMTASKLAKDTGYAQTKFVSEYIVRTVAEGNHGAFAGRNLRILRPGYIIGSLATVPGATGTPPNQRDFIWRLIVGCVAPSVGGYDSDEATRWLYVASVERVAASVVAMISDPSSCLSAERKPRGSRVCLVLDGLRFGDFWDVVRGCGYRLEPLASSEWMARLKRAIEEEGEKHTLFPLLHVLERGHHDASADTALCADLEDGEKLEAVKDVIDRNVRYLADVGFLPRRATLL